jgi:predicted NBD/HSP70 family sugar kinase
MQPMYYIGLDVHKRKISYCVKDGGGQIHAEGSISATRLDAEKEALEQKQTNIPERSVERKAFELTPADRVPFTVSQPT